MKKAFAIRVLACALAALIALFALGACSGQADYRYYGISGTGVTLNDDLTFAANLYHGTVKTGTYTESAGPDGVTLVTFTSGGVQAVGAIVDDVLTIPLEWRDGHGGHSNAFPLR